ncbi:MAG: hypothetical protein ABIC95_01160 [archaeon]
MRSRPSKKAVMYGAIIDLILVAVLISAGVAVGSTIYKNVRGTSASAMHDLHLSIGALADGNAENLRLNMADESVIAFFPVGQTTAYSSEISKNGVNVYLILRWTRPDEPGCDDRTLACMCECNEAKMLEAQSGDLGGNQVWLYPLMCGKVSCKAFSKEGAADIDFAHDWGKDFGYTRLKLIGDAKGTPVKDKDFGIIIDKDLFQMADKPPIYLERYHDIIAVCGITNALSPCLSPDLKLHIDFPDHEKEVRSLVASTKEYFKACEEGESEFDITIPSGLKAVALKETTVLRIMKGEDHILDLDIRFCEVRSEDEDFTGTRSLERDPATESCCLTKVG